MTPTDSARLEIKYFYLAVMENHHIARFEIAVDKTIVVEMHQAGNDLTEEHPREDWRQLPVCIDH